MVNAREAYKKSEPAALQCDGANEQLQRAAPKTLTKDKARIAANIAKLPEPLRKA